MPNKRNALYKLLLHDTNFFGGGFKKKTEELKELIMDETINRPNSHLKYLKDKHYHSTDKGCDIEMRISRTDAYKDISVQRYCHTHKCLCSKSGWELTWFGGTKSVNKYHNNGRGQFSRTYQLLKSSKNNS